MQTTSQLQPDMTAQTMAVRQKSRRKLFERIWLVVLQILLTALLITFLVPAIWMVSSSLKVSTEVFAHPIVWIPQNPRWENYLEVFRLPGIPFQLFIWNSTKVVVFAVLGTVISSAMVAYSFARLRWPGRDFFFAMLISTMMLPEVIMLIPRFIIFRNLGWIDTLLPLTVPYWFAITPVYVFLMRQFFKSIPMELEEAALIDGASRIRILFQIILPLSKPVIATVMVFAFLQHYNDYLNPLIYINSMKNWTLPLGIAALNADESFRATWELLFAASTVMVMPVIALFIVAQRYFVQGIAMTGFGGR
jgi:ABC-type glycerol-3-phosphate transport system permease component